MKTLYWRYNTGLFALKHFFRLENLILIKKVLIK